MTITVPAGSTVKITGTPLETAGLRTIQYGERSCTIRLDDLLRGGTAIDSVGPSAYPALMGHGSSNIPRYADVLATIRDLEIQIERGNGKRAESILTTLAGYLKEKLLSGADPECREMERAQQTMFAIDETGTLLSQGDFEGAANAASEAAVEWKARPR